MEKVQGIAAAAPAKASLSLKTVAEKLNNYFLNKNSTTFLIGEVAATLNVPKRRLYDVLNIMQPLGIVDKNGRGKYVWNGKMQPVLNHGARDDNSDKSHVRDQSSRFLEFIRDHEQSLISISDICDSVFDENKGQLRRLYDISAVFEVLNLVRRQPKTGDFLILPQLRNLFVTKMLPPKKRCVPFAMMDTTSQQVLVSPPPPATAALRQTYSVSATNAWLGATALN